MNQMLETAPAVTGFEGIDKLILNPHKPKLITVISRPAGGKSAFLLSSTKEMADYDITVAFYSFDMTKDQAERRLQKIHEGMYQEDSVAIHDCMDPNFDFYEERNLSLIRDNGYKIIYIDGLWHLQNGKDGVRSSLSESMRRLKNLVKELQVDVIVSLNVTDFRINKDMDSFELISPVSEDIDETLLEYADALIFMDRPAFYNPEKRDNPEIITAYVFNNPEGFAGEEKLLFDRNLARFEDSTFIEKHNSYIPEEPVTTIFIVCLDGTDEALHHAYRSSIRMLADFSLDFGDEGEPQYLDFNWTFIDKYRVLTVKTNGAGITYDFSKIPGITECLWIIYDDCSGWYASNDSEGKIMSRKEQFGIPEADYEVDADSVSETSGYIGFSTNSPDRLSIGESDDLPF